MKILRSLLYSPGNRPKLMEKGPGFGADALIFDLEDRVPRDQKAEARAIARAYIEKLKGKFAIFVRVNGLHSGMIRDDLEAVAIDGLAGIAIPKVESPEMVRAVDALLGEVERARGLPTGSMEISVGLESARAVHFAYEICSASARVSAVGAGLGKGGDLETDVGYLWSKEGMETLYIRSKVLLAARAAGVQNPLDGAYSNARSYNPSSDEAGLIRSAMIGRQLGYRAKKCIHPSQVEPVNRIFMPTQREIDYYSRVLEAFEAAVAQGSAATSVEGKLVDYAQAANARKVLSWAEGIAT